MPSHIHKFSPGASVTFDTTADVIGGRVVEITGSRRVANTTGPSTKVVGAAATDVKAGEDVLVLRGGIQTLTSSAAIPAGSRVDSAAGGKVAVVAGGVRGFGTAITTVTAADQPIDVALD